MKNLQHIQVPQGMTKHKEIKPRDMLIYANIKKYMNNETKEAFPSITTIANISGISRPTVIKSIKILEKYKYITIRKEGRKNIYKFTPYKYFEPFAMQFLEKKEIDSLEKSVLIALQEFMYKDVEGVGKITIANTELAKKINMPYSTFMKVQTSLMYKNYLSMYATKKKDMITGIFIKEKFYHLDALQQEIVFALRDLSRITMTHTEQLEKANREIEALKRQIKIIENDRKEF
jgi:DNA-binding MarR family transcriptional regulator